MKSDVKTKTTMNISKILCINTDELGRMQRSRDYEGGCVETQKIKLSCAARIHILLECLRLTGET